MEYKDLKRVDDFKYLGSWINTTERDLKIRIAKAWAASNKLDKSWKSSLSRKLKVHFFRATVVQWRLCCSMELSVGLSPNKNRRGLTAATHDYFVLPLILAGSRE